VSPTGHCFLLGRVKQDSTGRLHRLLGLSMLASCGIYTAAFLEKNTRCKQGHTNLGIKRQCTTQTACMCQKHNTPHRSKTLACCRSTRCTTTTMISGWNGTREFAGALRVTGRGSVLWRVCVRVYYSARSIIMHSIRMAWRTTPANLLWCQTFAATLRRAFFVYWTILYRWHWVCAVPTWSVAHTQSQACRAARTTQHVGGFATTTLGVRSRGPVFPMFSILFSVLVVPWCRSTSNCFPPHNRRTQTRNTDITVRSNGPSRSIVTWRQVSHCKKTSGTQSAVLCYVVCPSITAIIILRSGVP